MTDLVVEPLDGGAIVRLTLTRPERGNSLTPALLERLEDAVLGLAKGGARTAVLTGAGEKAFSTGYDVETLMAELASAAGPGTAAATPDLETHPLERALRAIAGSPVPVVAAVRGAATGAGFELACACDFRVVGRGARFLMPPARLGVVYSATGIARLAAIVGPQRAREIFMLAEPVDSTRAAAIGLATRLADDDAVQDDALTLARRLAENAPLSLAGAKKILAHLAPRLTPDAAAEVARLRAEAFRSRDLAEGVSAFMEKRKPKFEGR